MKTFKRIDDAIYNQKIKENNFFKEFLREISILEGKLQVEKIEDPRDTKVNLMYDVGQIEDTDSKKKIKTFIFRYL